MKDKIISYFVLILISILLSSCVVKKELSKETSQKSAIVKVEQAEKPFPKNWYGKWRGTLVTYNYQGGVPMINEAVQKMPMEIHFGSTDSTHRHKFSLIYRDNARNYELVAIDSKNGHYQTDEKNTIYLDAFYFGGLLISRYEVNGKMFTSQIEKRGDKLHFSMTVGSLTPIATTGDEEVNNFPPVNSFGVDVSQRAELTKYE